MPGVGEKTAERLIQHFGTEEEALEAIKRGDVLALMQVKGVSRNSAVNIVKAASGSASQGDFLRTPDVRSIHRHLISMLEECAHTQSARVKMSALQPYPAGSAEIIRQRQQEVAAHLDIVNSMSQLEFDEVNRLFKKVVPLRMIGDVRVKERGIITASRTEYEKMQHLRGYIDVCLVESFSECLDLASGYSHLLLLGTEFAGYDFPEHVEVDVVSGFEQLESWQAVPELELSFFTVNRESLLAGLRILCILRRYTNRFSYLQQDELGEVLHLIEGLEDSGDVMQEGEAEEVCRLERIRSELLDAVVEIEKRLHADFSEVVEKRSVTLSGREILEAVSRGDDLRYVLEQGLSRDYRRLVNPAIEELSERFSLTSAERQRLERIFPEEIVYPFSVDRQRLEELQQYVLRRLSVLRFKATQKLAGRLCRYRGVLERLIEELIEFDVMFSVACFARIHHLTMPLLTENMGLCIQGGVNLFIEGDAVPVDYAIGSVPESPGRATRVLLSGVNSGGKTTLLELMAQVVILAHMGLPVPARAARVGLLEEVFYFGRSKGSLGAGAFEATVKSFAEIPGAVRKLVLADELEAITEPGASARIIGGVLEMAGTDTLLVFVSHLAELILEHAGCEVRVDGIEARGLDDAMNLVVERTPRYNYLAKSTPQLIVERLSKVEKTHSEFYQHLLDKFKE